MIALAALVVAEVAAIPAAVSNAIHFLFTVAAALQGAICLRELVLGWVEHRAAAGADVEGSLASALGIIRLLVSIAAFSLAAILRLEHLCGHLTGREGGWWGKSGSVRLRSAVRRLFKEQIEHDH